MGVSRGLVRRFRSLLLKPGIVIQEAKRDPEHIIGSPEEVAMYGPHLQSLMFQIRLGVSVKITHQNEVVQGIEIHAYHYSTHPPDALQTGSSIHGKAVLCHSIVLFSVVYKSDFSGINQWPDHFRSSCRCIYG